MNPFEALRLSIQETPIDTGEFDADVEAAIVQAFREACQTEGSTFFLSSQIQDALKDKTSTSENAGSDDDQDEADSDEEGYNDEDPQDGEGTQDPGYTDDGDIEMGGSGIMSVEEWLMNDEFTEWIQTLHNIYGDTPPKSVTTPPHDYQMNAAARLVRLINSPFKGGILGDAMGLGKTFTCAIIIAMLKSDRKPGKGPFLLVVPKATQSFWRTELLENFTVEERVKLHILTDPKTTAQDLFQYDVVMTTYQFVHAQWRRVQQYKTMVKKIRNGEAIHKLLKRPTACLISEIFDSLDDADQDSSDTDAEDYTRVDFSFSLLICDEAQAIRNYRRPTGIAVNAIRRDSSIAVSGTFVHHNWWDIFGLTRLLSTPIKTIGQFRAAFGELDDKNQRVAPSPDSLQGRMLQRMLMGFVIARPEDTLVLPPLTDEPVFFELNSDEEMEVLLHFEEYKRSGKKSQSVPGISSTSDGTSASLGAAQRAIQAAAHPILNELSLESADEHQEDNAELKDWISRVEKDDTATNSSKMQKLLEVISGLMNHFTGERIVIFSIYARFLDIVEIAIRKLLIYAKCLRLDGRRSSDERARTLDEFRADTNGLSTILLVTAGVGGAGLNLQKARLMIQCEPWWVHNDEKQARKRLQRQGQVKDVFVYSLRAVNSPMEAAIIKSRDTKGKWVDAIMKAVVRKDEDPLVIPSITDTQETT